MAEIAQQDAGPAGVRGRGLAHNLGIYDGSSMLASRSLAGSALFAFGRCGLNAARRDTARQSAEQEHSFDATAALAAHSSVRSHNHWTGATNPR
jgi:hypothetical protein